jgi:hypothetical protein
MEMTKGNEKILVNRTLVLQRLRNIYAKDGKKLIIGRKNLRSNDGTAKVYVVDLETNNVVETIDDYEEFARKNGGLRAYEVMG